jgi:uncharacterized membrane protein YGL010W
MTEQRQGLRAEQRRIDQLLAEYGESHRNPTNKRVHWIAVPVIFWSVLALLSELPFPSALAVAPWFDWALVAGILGTLYYVMLSIPLAAGMAVFTLACLGIIALWPHELVPLWQAALGLFVVAWAFQFWGHRIEGKKPSFFKDLQFLLIGPAWLMSFLFSAAGLKY